jgi:ATPase family associated with various cellular activities (AAA)
MSHRRLQRKKAKATKSDDEVEISSSRRRRPMLIDSDDDADYTPSKGSKRKRPTKTPTKKKTPPPKKETTKPTKKRKKSPKPPKKPKLNVTDAHIDNLAAFLELYKYDIKLPINLDAFVNLQTPLTKLNNMIGMKQLKQEILDMVIYYLLKLPVEFTDVMKKVYEAEEGSENEDSFIDQDYDPEQEEEMKQHIRSMILGKLASGEFPDPAQLEDARFDFLEEEEREIVAHVHDTLDMLHTVICGPPGTGKSHVAQIISEIYQALGFLEPDREMVKANSADFVSNHIGETTMKTNELLQSAIGGVLFFDEAYSISGNSQGKPDEFGTNAVDTFTAYLTEHKHDFVMIIAGYEADLESRFFSLNKGLRRRFPWKFVVEKYTPDELRQIFELMATKAGYSFPKPIPLDWFEMNHSCFPHFGGSMETLLSKVKIVQGRRVIFLPKKNHNEIMMSDMNKGLTKYKSHSDYTKSLEQQRITQSYYM